MFTPFKSDKRRPLKAPAGIQEIPAGVRSKKDHSLLGLDLWLLVVVSLFLAGRWLLIGPFYHWHQHRGDPAAAARLHCEQEWFPI
jgi:hypothetical protein